MLCELVEQIFIPFCEHLLSRKQRARPRPRRRRRLHGTIRSWKPQRLKHHRLARTRSFASHARTKRNDFLVGLTPQPPIYVNYFRHQQLQG